MSVTEILNRLESVKKTPNGWQSRCPGHEDRKASLSIKNSDGKTALYCHAGCSNDAIVATMGLSLKDLFDEPQTSKNGYPKRKIEAVYNYTDEQGATLFQAVRYEPKEFRQRRPDGNGGWIYNLEGVRRVLYRLPDLLKADNSATVFLCEGEKDVNALWKIGLVASCNPMGAGKWRDDYNEVLRGREVVILPDKDKAGNDHAETVARSLYRIAALVKILRLPNLPDKGDVSDWLANGGDAESLCVMAENASVWIPETAGTPHEVISDNAPKLLTTWNELSCADIPPGEQIIHELERGELGMIAAVTNGGKSTLIRNLAITLACGGQLFPVCKMSAPRRVYLLDFETSPSRLQVDFQKMTKHLTNAEKAMVGKNLAMCIALDRANWMDDEPLSLSKPEHLNFVRMNALAFKADLIIVDTVSAGFSIGEENSNSEVTARILKPLVRLARETGAAVLMAHHIGKGNEDNKAGEGAYQARGASSFGNFCGLVLNLKKDPNDKARRVLSNPKAKGLEFEDTALQLDPESRWFQVTNAPVREIRTSYQILVALFTDERVWKRHEIEAALQGSIGTSTLKRCLSEAVENGDLRMPKRGEYLSVKFGSQPKMPELSQAANP